MFECFAQFNFSVPNHFLRQSLICVLSQIIPNLIKLGKQKETVIWNNRLSHLVNAAEMRVLWYSAYFLS